MIARQRPLAFKELQFRALMRDFPLATPPIPCAREGQSRWPASTGGYSLLAAAALFAACGCAGLQDRDAFEEARSYFERLPLGTEIREIEKRLNLPAPQKTLVGSSFYHYRAFVYVRRDGLLLEIGLFQTSEASEYPDGTFVYIGHHTVSIGGRIWKRWVWVDGVFEYRRPGGGCWCGTRH